MHFLKKRENKGEWESYFVQFFVISRSLFMYFIGSLLGFLDFLPGSHFFLFKQSDTIGK